MDTQDQDDIIKKVKEAGNDENNSNDNEEDNTSDSGNDTGDNNPSDTESSMDFSDNSGGSNGEEGKNGGLEEEIFETKNQVEIDNPTLYPDGWKEMDGLFLANPKKNNMFQPGSNDVLGENENFDFNKSSIESASGDKIVKGDVNKNGIQLYISLSNDNVKYFIDSNNDIIKYDGKTGERYPIGNLKEYNTSDKFSDLHESLIKPKKNSIFVKNNIKLKLKETFKQDDMDDSSAEPMVKPEPTTKPSIAPTKKPNTAPSRKNKPFLPMPNVQPDPKAKG